MLLGYSKLPYYTYSEHCKRCIMALYVILLSTIFFFSAKPNTPKKQVGK